MRKYTCRFCLALIVAFTFNLLWSPNLFALSCAPDERTPLQIMREADAVFIAKTYQSEDGANAYQIVKIEQAIKGKVTKDDTVKIYFDTIWLGPSQNNEKYLWMVDKDPQKDGYVQALCRTNNVALKDEKFSDYQKHFTKFSTNTKQDLAFISIGAGIVLGLIGLLIQKKKLGK